MMTAQALTPLNLHQATHIGIYILYCLDPRLGQTGPHQAFQTLISQTRPPLAFQTRLGQTCLLTTKKRIKSLWVSFYGGVFVAVWVSKIFRLNKQAFVNILEKLLYVW